MSISPSSKQPVTATLELGSDFSRPPKVQRVTWASSRDAAGKYQENIKEVSRKHQGSIREASQKHQGSIREALTHAGS